MTQAAYSDPSQSASRLGRNVAALADGPTVPEHEVRALSPKAAAEVLAGVRGDRLEALFTVAIACGLRQSEALGLRWDDVDLDGNAMSFQRTIQRVNRSYQVFEPKTKRSRRTFSMPGPVASSLRAHMARQATERLRVGSAWDGDA